MKQEILSLRNIYKFLTLNDYPIYSQGIIKKENRTGLTLTKFCYDNILIDFRNRKCGKVIWRANGERNRYVSAICNRSDYISLYAEYAEEIATAADEETVLRQIQQFMAFLLERQFNAEVFRKKLSAWILILKKDDDAFTETAVDFFHKVIDDYQELKGQGMMADAFWCGYILTFLTFHALMGNGEGEEVLCRLREDENYSICEVWNRYQSESAEKRTAEFLTGVNTELSGQPLKAGHFFGREAEMFELREMLLHGGAYLISGMGGVGKTELMRQFLKCCQDEALVDYIGVIQYEGGLAQSTVKAFGTVCGTSIEENYNEVLERICLYADKRIMIIVDNMDGDVSEAELEKFLRVPATIFVTSRYQKVKGLKTYRLKSIGKEAGSLIFRDNYGSCLSEEDKTILEEIVSEDLWCHILTLRLLAKTAKNNRWNLMKLQNQLKAKALPVGYTESEHYKGLRQVYERMYGFSNLKNMEKAVLRLFAAFPYKSYSIAFAREYLQSVLQASCVKENTRCMDIEAVLEKFWIGGWVEKSYNSYSMHPFIAECVLSTSLTEMEIEPFLDYIISKWEALGIKMDIEWLSNIQYDIEKYLKSNWELVDVTMMIYPLVEKISGKFQEKYVQLYISSFEFIQCYYGVCDQANLKKILDKGKNLSEISKLSISILKCKDDKDMDALIQRVETLMSNPHISVDLKTYYIHTLGEKLFSVGRTEEQERLYNYVFENCKNPSWLMAVYIEKGQILTQRGDVKGAVALWEKGIELGQQMVNKNSRYMEGLYAKLCNMYIILGQYEKAEIILKELDSFEQTEVVSLNAMNYMNRGILMLQQEKGDYGVANLEEATRLIKAQCRIEPKGEIAYTGYLNNLAVAYHKSKQFEEAEKIYQEVMERYSHTAGMAAAKQTTLGNIGVMYLDWGKTEKAMGYLIKAYEVGGSLGGRLQGIASYDMSKAYRALGNREKEVEYLKEAIPLLEEAYGSEYPKVKDAVARLEENKL